ncbi:hypothetical protein SPWS13_3938 [Shewanella putrefaciens]|nr:hypothetical protein SPWS13_3938 [Shewanella putrefaciens]
MQVNMLTQGLPPRVQHHSATQLTLKVFSLHTKLRKRLPHRLKQGAV